MNAAMKFVVSFSQFKFVEGENLYRIERRYRIGQRGPTQCQLNIKGKYKCSAISLDQTMRNH